MSHYFIQNHCKSYKNSNYLHISLFYSCFLSTVVDEWRGWCCTSTFENGSGRIFPRETVGPSTINFSFSHCLFNSLVCFNVTTPPIVQLLNNFWVIFEYFLRNFFDIENNCLVDLDLDLDLAFRPIWGARRVLRRIWYNVTTSDISILTCISVRVAWVVICCSAVQSNS